MNKREDKTRKRGAMFGADFEYEDQPSEQPLISYRGTKSQKVGKLAEVKKGRGRATWVPTKVSS